MQLRHIQELQPHDERGIVRVTAMDWSPNNQKLAVVTTERVVHLYDEAGERRDRFSTKPAEKTGPKNYTVKSLCWSPDSTKLAVAQSDNIVYVYKLGIDWGDKKSICNKFMQSSPVTCMAWPSARPGEVVFGLAEGKVKVGQLRSNKPATLYSTESYVVSLCAAKGGAGDLSGIAVLSGHVDGSIYSFVFDDAGGMSGQRKFADHECIPYCLKWGKHVVVAGNGDEVVFYDAEGNVQDSFDHSRAEPALKEFTSCEFNPSGDSVVLGNWNCFLTYNFNQRSSCWEEIGNRQVPNYYSITQLAWKPDGGRLALGNLCGVVDLYDACIRRYKYQGRFEFTYVALSQVIVKRLVGGEFGMGKVGDKIVLKSGLGHEITKIDIYQDRFLVGKTTESLLLADLETKKLSEVNWRSGGDEKFVFDYETCCICFQASELTVIEYGNNEIVGQVRTESISGHLISIRINERPAFEEVDGGRTGAQIENKKIAYLLDKHTICIKDLHTLSSVTVPSDSRIDWLELNAAANVLLFRDKRKQLHLFDIATETRTTMLHFCNYVQWVPFSDVVVAQSRNNLNIWYNIHAPDKVTVVPVQGEVEEIIREEEAGKTEVVIDEGVGKTLYKLDDGLIGFSAAIDDRNFGRAMQILDRLGDAPEADAMWTSLSKAALQHNDLIIAERCFAALGNVSKARYLRKVNKLVAQNTRRGRDGRDHWQVRAKLNQLRKDFGAAEDVLVQQGKVDEAIEMYQRMHQYDEAIQVAERRQHPQAEDMRKNYYDYLLSTSQEEQAAALKEREKDYNAAITLYLKGNLPAKAMRIIKQNGGFQTHQLESVASALTEAGMYDKAGELYEQMDQMQRALDSYTKGNAYRRAVELARHCFPAKVVKLEENWGDWLVSQKQTDMAINHYIEANCHQKAIEAALNSRQWTKAVQLVEAIKAEDAKPYYRRLAVHYQEAKQFDEAERNFVRAGRPEDAVEMYTRANRWEAAHKVAMSYMTESEVGMLYISQAQRMEAQGRLKEAERLYLTVHEPDLAINMYKKQRKYDQMIRLVTTYRKELVKETHLHLAQQLEMEGNLRDAEHHYAEAGEWLLAVNMYRSNDQWDEAIRVAKAHGGINASKRVAYAWALALGGDAGSKLLTKLGLIEPAIDYAIESGAFDHAFELARMSLPKKLPEVHLKHALYLEDEERFKEAEEEFIKAAKPKEAIDMYIHQQDWANASRVAEQYDPASVPDVYVAQARVLVSRKEFQRAEGLFISASKPEEALKAYMDAAQWHEARRIAKRFLPGKINDVNIAEQRARRGDGPVGKDDVQQAAKMWIDSRRWGQAIDEYLRVTKEQLNDDDALEELWENAVKLAAEHERDRYNEVAADVAGRLKGIGRFQPAAELFKDIDRVEDAVKCFVAAASWDKARELCRTRAPGLSRMVEKAHRDKAFATGDAHGMVASGNVADGLDMMARKGQWGKLFEVARTEGVRVAKYAVQYAERLASDDKLEEAARVLAEHGSLPQPAHFALYEKIARGLLGRTAAEEAALPSGGGGEEKGADEDESGIAAAVRHVRTFLYELLQSLKDSPSGERAQDLEMMMMAAHYSSIRHTCLRNGLHNLAAKVAVGMLRYCGFVPADKLFYNAGMACKNASSDHDSQNLAFVLLNRYIDLTEAIEDGDASMLDNADFQGTCIPEPFRNGVPRQQYQAEEKREEARDWVLTVSMDSSVEQALPPHDPAADPSIYDALYPSKAAKCIVTGFPIPERQRMDINNSTANRADWNTFVEKSKTCPWTGQSASPQYA